MNPPAGRDAPSPATDEHGVGAGVGRGARTGGGADEPPPLLGRWSRLYLLIVLELLVIILLLYRLTRTFD